MLLEHPVLLTAITDNVKLEMLLEILRQAEIPAVVKDDSTGNYGRLYMGVSCYAREVWVEQEKLVEAQDILSGYFSDDGDEAVEAQEELTSPAIQQSEDTPPAGHWWSARGKLVRALIFVMVGLAVLGILSGGIGTLGELFL